MQPSLSEMQDWALAAGEILRQNFRQTHEIRRKGRFDLVTEADTASETLLLERIRGRYPGHAIVTEESGQFDGHTGTWYIDPLDGTINYAHGMPVFCVSLAYGEHDQALLGLIYDPIREEIFSAERGKGAWLNGEPLHVSDIEHINDSLLVTGFPYDTFESIENNLNHYSNFARQTQGVRRLGSAALDLCYVAAGRLDGYWEIKIKVWDIAAGALIVEEAGGRVTDILGNPKYLTPPYSIIAANPAMHGQMLAVINNKT